MALTLDQLNNLSEKEFTNLFGEIFEHSPWIAKIAAHMRPFSSFDIAFDTMKQIVVECGSEAQLTLIKEHPELGKRIQMSQSSVKEQQGAGLDSLTPEEYHIFSEANQAYMEKFRFPFIIAVSGKDKNDILQAMKERLSSNPENEFQTALQEIYKIAYIRFKGIIETYK